MNRNRITLTKGRSGKKMLLLAALMMLALLMAGCGKKTYSTLEEFVNDNPSAQKELDMTISDSNGTGSMEVSGNTVIVKLYYNEKVWGVDSSIDAQLKAQMDQYYAGAQVQTQMAQSINQFSQASGIDASEISARYEFYNPGASTPSYTYTYPEP